MSVVIYVVEWFDSAGRSVGQTDYLFTPGDGRVRYATAGQSDSRAQIVPTIFDLGVQYPRFT